MSTRKIHGFFQASDPSSEARALMAHRSDVPIAVMLHAKKRSSTRVKRPMPDNWHLNPMPKGYRGRITLANVWGPKP